MLTDYRARLAQLFFVGITISCLLAEVRASDQSAQPPSNTDILTTARKLMEENQCVKKGGLGIVGPRTYVVTSSQNNELILPDGSHWIGQEAQVKQISYVLDGKVYSAPKDDANFSIMNSLLVSFEGARVYFFDFKTFEGGFYLRSASPH